MISAEVKGEDYSQPYRIVQLGRLRFSKAWVRQQSCPQAKEDLLEAPWLHGKTLQ